MTDNVGVDAWIDMVSSESAEMGLKSLAFGGELAVCVDNCDY